MSTAGRKWAAGLYWIGVVMTLACVALVLAGNTELVYQFEHRYFPLSWTLAGIAVLAFLAAEFCPLADSVSSAVEDGSPELAQEWEAAEV